MCFELDSSPPVPVIAGAAVSHDDLVLESADATRFVAFEASPDEATTIGIVVLPDARGLYSSYEHSAGDVAMALGGGLMIESPNSASEVRVVPERTSDFRGARSYL